MTFCITLICAYFYFLVEFIFGNLTKNTRNFLKLKKGQFYYLFIYLFVIAMLSFFTKNC